VHLPQVFLQAELRIHGSCVMANRCIA
jgi:hypothetical protein